jgi:hypothetical protein
MFQQTSLTDAAYQDPLSEDSSSNVGSDVPPPDPPPSNPSTTSRGSDRTKIVGLGAMGALVAVGIGLIVASPRKPTPDSVPTLSLTTADANDGGGGKDNAAAMKEASLTVMDAAAIAPVVRPPPVWRASNLKDDQNVELAEGTFGKNGFVGALSLAGLPRAEIRRVAHAFEGIHRIERPSANDAFVLAKDKVKGTIVAFEYSTSPLDVWQARFEAGSDHTVAKKLDLFVEHRRVASSLVVSGDLAKAIAAAGMRPEIVEVIDDALEGHVDPGSIRAGVRMRVAATEDWVDGTFARVKVDAIEFVPKSGTPLRVYFYERDATVEGNSRRAPLPGFYDAKGKQPYRGQFRTPLPLARVTSRFNPKRMHPVLKVVMPHQGVDYAGVTGTPVYASAAGTIITAGNGGPCGNMVEIDHGGGISTVYCHLKGFAQGLHSGQKVEPRQLVGYVGQTGRVTGPHLHFGVKKNGVFIDPLGLKMDGVRVLPPADRDAFARKRADLDVIIDGVALPSAADVPEENEDKDLHTE